MDTKLRLRICEVELGNRRFHQDLRGHRAPRDRRSFPRLKASEV